MKFTNKSKQLINFISKTDFISNIKHTKNTSKILLQLYNNVIEAHQFLMDRKRLEPIYQLSVKQINHPWEMTKPKKMKYAWMPLQVVQHIESQCSVELSYTFSLFDRKITLIFMEESANKVKSYQKCIDLIIMWLFILHMYSPRQCANTLTIYFYFTSLEKKLPHSSSETLNENHINTAFTFSCHADGEIVLFRKEEWFKVLIHETFHTFGLDFSDMDNTHCTQRIRKMFKVISDVNAFEAYTEFWAETWNACFCSYLHMKEKSNRKEFLFWAESYINIERKYSYFQLVKTLAFMGLTYKSLYLEDKVHSSLREKLYKEKTNVLAYYVMKTVLMSNYEDFLTWCFIHNISLVLFKKTQKHIMEFCTFLENHYKNARMNRDIDNAEQFFHENKQNQTFLFKNLRMSVCEMDV